MKKIAIAAYMAGILVTRVTPVQVAGQYAGRAYVLYTGGMADVKAAGHVTAHGSVKLVTVSGKPVVCFS